MHHALGVTSRSSVYFHGTSSLAIAFRVATLISLPIFTVFLVEGSTECILVIRPLLLYQRLIDSLLVRVVALHLSVHSLLIVQALVELLDNGPSFLVTSVVPTSCPRICLRNTETSGSICHVHVFVPRLCCSTCGGG